MSGNENVHHRQTYGWIPVSHPASPHIDVWTAAASRVAGQNCAVVYTKPCYFRPDSQHPRVTSSWLAFHRRGNTNLWATARFCSVVAHTSSHQQAATLFPAPLLLLLPKLHGDLFSRHASPSGVYVFVAVDERGADVMPDEICR